MDKRFYLAAPIIVAFAAIVWFADPFSLVFFGLVPLVQEHAVAVAKAYPARVAPLLEDYRRAHGVYPKKLGQLPSRPSPPRLMRGFGCQSDEQSYWFSFPQPGGLIDTWNYDSQTQTWQLST